MEHFNGRLENGLLAWLFRGSDPHKVFNKEIELLRDLEPVEVNESEAAKFNGDKRQVRVDNGESDQWFFQPKKGARLCPEVVLLQPHRRWSDLDWLLTDPCWLYKHLHPSEAGAVLGRDGEMVKILKDRRHERDVQSDILQETFISTTAAWIDLLLSRRADRSRSPSVLTGRLCRRSRSRRRSCMIAGGPDDLSQEGLHELANMKATNSAE
uniref:K Homology domain-containing protein n=1 Tax=Mycena chlorophos TaxID=658473 RepID=A0ABQ0LMG9_MYCCL|nr:predicted protein [Mycena chlorophos]